MCFLSNAVAPPIRIAEFLINSVLNIFLMQPCFYNEPWQNSHRREFYKFLYSDLNAIVMRKRP